MNKSKPRGAVKHGSYKNKKDAVNGLTFADKKRMNAVSATRLKAQKVMDRIKREGIA